MNNIGSDQMPHPVFESRLMYIYITNTMTVGAGGSTIFTKVLRVFVITYLQVSVLTEGLAAVRAPEGFLALVQTLDVLHQRRLVGELLAAQVAAVLPLAAVGDLMSLLERK